MILRLNRFAAIAACLTLFFAVANASLGDRLPDFKECLKVRSRLPFPRVDSQQRV